MQRDRSLSVGKRKLSADNAEEPTASNASKIPKFDSTSVFEQLKGQESLLGEVKVTLGKLDNEVNLDENVDPNTKATLVGLTSAVKLLLKSQENLTSVLVDVFKVKTVTSATDPTVSKVSSVQAKKNNAVPAPKQPDSGEKKVKQAIRDAEKKVLLFNLDLGKAPTMNKDTLSRKELWH
jgi:hypothetical protein